MWERVKVARIREIVIKISYSESDVRNCVREINLDGRTFLLWTCDKPETNMTVIISSPADRVCKEIFKSIFISVPSNPFQYKVE